MNVLNINLSSSSCKSCGGGADPNQKTHDSLLGWGADPEEKGCGVEWTHLSTGYSDFDGHHDSIKEMRPDLIFIEP